MRKTPFYDTHVAAGAKIVDFGGYAMPVQFSGIIDEHNTVRRTAGVFDVSHMGEIEIGGTDAADFLQYLTLNDISKLYEGRAQYSAIVNEKGGIIDDLLIYRMRDKFMMVVNAANKDKDLDWIKKQAESFKDIRINDISEQTALIAVQGPASAGVLQKLTKKDLTAIKFYHFQEEVLAGTEMIISRTGYTGELGFELYYNSAGADNEHIWKSIMQAGKDDGVCAAGLGARDTLRLEMGMPLYGNDIDESTNPFEARLAWITKLDKGNFIGRDELLKIKEKKMEKMLTGFIVKYESLARKAIPRKGYKVSKDGEITGSVTSGTFSPSLNTSIALGYINPEYAKSGTEVVIEIRGNKVDFTVTDPPFLKK